MVLGLGGKVMGGMEMVLSSIRRMEERSSFRLVGIRRIVMSLTRGLCLLFKSDNNKKPLINLKRNYPVPH